MAVLDALHGCRAGGVCLNKTHPGDQRIDLEELRKGARCLPYTLRPRSPREECLSSHPHHLLHTKFVHSHERLLLARELRVERAAIDACQFEDVRYRARRVAPLRGECRRGKEDPPALILGHLRGRYARSPRAEHVWWFQRRVRHERGSRIGPAHQRAPPPFARGPFVTINPYEQVLAQTREPWLAAT